MSANNLLNASSAKELSEGRVGLKPNHSLLHWMMRSAKSLATPRKTPIDADELSKHSTFDDCWILLENNIYDVTTYLPYHPGGVEQLLRAAGRDATPLFHHYHPWINFESMLKSCFMGTFLNSSRVLLLTTDPQGVINANFLPVQESRCSTSRSSVDSSPKLIESVVDRKEIILCESRIVSVNSLTDDTFLYSVEIQSSMRFYIPLGHHIQVTLNEEGGCFRAYTPILVSQDGKRLSFLIKIYENGRFTSRLKMLKIGDCIKIGSPSARFDVEKVLFNAEYLVMLAAGTGITPMLRIIADRLQSNSGIYLYTFNRHKDHIPDRIFSYCNIDLYHHMFRLTKFVDADEHEEFSRHATNFNLIAKDLEMLEQHRFAVFLCGPDLFVAESLDFVKKRCLETVDVFAF